MRKFVIAMLVLATAPAFAQNSGTIRQPGTGDGPTGTVQQPYRVPSSATSQAAGQSFSVPATPPNAAAQGGISDNAAQPSGMEFHQMMPVK